jgi:hypothetical protein
VRDSLAALGSRLPPGPLPPFGSAEAAQWFDDWNSSMESHMRGRAGGGAAAQEGGGLVRRQAQTMSIPCTTRIF